MRFDLARSPNEDLLDPVLTQKLQSLICLGCFVGAGGGPVCSRHKASWTQVAQAYPEGVANALARALLQKTLFCEEGRCFDPASCAIAGSGRIGEASHPGPRRPRGELRTGLLADVPLVEPRTLEIQDRVLGVFLRVDA